MRAPVLLHGFTGSTTSWDGVVDALSHAHAAPLLVDLPGHGRCAVPTETFTLASTLASIGAAGHWPTDVVGYSMGGRIALHFAANHPERVRRLVLESASPGLADPEERDRRRLADEALAGRIVQRGIEAFVDEWERAPLFASHARLDPEVRRRLRDARLRNDPERLARALRALGTGALPSLWERLPRISTPTLLLVGEADAKYVDVARRMAAAMPDARVAVVEGSGHTVHLERPVAWVSAVADFLAR